MNDIKEMKEIALFLFEKKITTHIDTEDGSWFNGLILELHDSFIVLHDRVLGETPVAFSKISRIERWRG